MSSVQDMIVSALSRNKLSKSMYSKLVKNRTPTQDCYLTHSSSLAGEGKLRESLEALYLAVKNFPNHLAVDKILPIVSNIVVCLRQDKTKDCNSSRNPFSCLACCGVLYEPVTIPCGHTYCRRCLTKDNFKVCLGCQVPTPGVEASQELCSNVLVSTLVGKWWSTELRGVELRTIANKHFVEKDILQAIELYTEANKCAPLDHLVLSNRSHAFHSLGRSEDALRDATDATLRCPIWAKGHFRQANALLSLGQEEDALASFLVCASLENSGDLNTLLKEISRMLLLVMGRRVNPRHSPRHSPDGYLKFVASLEGEETAGGLKEAAEEGEGRRSSLRKRRPSEEVTLVAKILKRFEAKMKQVRSSSSSAYVRSVDPCESLKGEFECSLCFHCLWQPVTTPCGHTFCRSCLDRSLDHAIHCPLCKTSLRNFLAENRSNVTEFLECAMQQAIPSHYHERELQYEAEMSEFAKAGIDLQHEIPIFVATLAIPSIACPLHVFEPRYRLMIRRVMEAGTREFGMCLPSQTDKNGYSNFGTMLEVREVKLISDGRRVVIAVGSRRFKCISKGVKDGYNTATVEYLKDDLESGDSLLQLQRLHMSVHEEAKIWFSSVEGQTKRRILNHYGPMPPVEGEYWALSDGPTWVWWLVAILPMEQSVKLRILKEKSLKARLQLVKRILAYVLNPA